MKILVDTSRKMRRYLRKVENRLYRFELNNRRKLVDDFNKKPSSKDSMLSKQIRYGEWEYGIKCNYCGSFENKLYLFNPKISFYDKDFRIVECLNCGLIFNDPRPNFYDIFNFYSNSDWSEKMFYRKLNRKDVLEYHGNIIDEIIEIHENPKTLFDVGCGAGTLLIKANEKGIKGFGNDINSFSCKKLNQIGFRVFNEPTISLPIEEKYDVITMLDYIEHTYTPFDELNKLVNNLNDDGILYLKTLYLDCPNHRNMGKSWNLFGQGHFHYYYTYVLNNMINDVGLEIIRQHLSDAIIKIVARKI